MKVLRLCVLALFSSLVATAQTQPKVVFFGDGLTAGWDLSSNPNWINKGLPGFDYQSQTSNDLVAQFQSDVVSLHPAIVHILAGAADTANASPASQIFIPVQFRNNIMTMVAEAKAANIKVILGTSPPPPYYIYNMTPLNAWIEAYGAANNIPVVNYADALCGCVGSVGPIGGSGDAYAITITSDQSIDSGFVPLLEDSNPNAPNYLPAPIVPTAAGYALMTQMAQSAIAALEGVTLKSGWLQNIGIDMYNDSHVAPLPSDFNTALVGTVIQFVPYGAYSDGSYRTLVNTNFAGSNGTWSSSNPAVMYVGQDGQAWAISPGQSNINYTSPTGVHFSPWGMTVFTCGQSPATPC